MVSKCFSKWQEKKKGDDVYLLNLKKKISIHVCVSYYNRFQCTWESPSKGVHLPPQSWGNGMVNFWKVSGAMAWDSFLQEFVHVQHVVEHNQSVVDIWYMCIMYHIIMLHNMYYVYVYANILALYWYTTMCTTDVDSWQAHVQHALC